MGKPAKRILNLVGPQIRDARRRKGLRQKDLAGKLQMAGLRYIDENKISKIETQARTVLDFELGLMATILSVSLDSLYPLRRDIKRRAPDAASGRRTPDDE
ncbi:MAG: helix-turn-helix transcriptional regulator [Bacteroidota bacterium]